MTEAYARNKANLLAHDHNYFLYQGYEAACADYRTALDHLAYVAARKGIKIAYKTDSNGYITID